MEELEQGKIYEADCLSCKAYSHCEYKSNGPVKVDGNMAEIYDMTNHFGEDHPLTQEHKRNWQFTCLRQGGTYVADTEEINRLIIAQGLGLEQIVGDCNECAGIDTSNTCYDHDVRGGVCKTYVDLMEETELDYLCKMSWGGIY